MTEPLVYDDKLSVVLGCLCGCANYTVLAEGAQVTVKLLKLNRHQNVKQ